MTYPAVRNEFETVGALLQGKSIARFGDGELKLIDGKEYFREPPCEKLSAELREIIQRPHEDCLVGIPTMAPEGPKYEGWTRHAERFLKVLDPATVQYYSAFITRPDSAPWINTVEYATLVAGLWRKRRTVVLAEPGNSILKVAQLSAKKLRHITCPHREAYALIDRLEAALVSSKADIALLSCGPTATCLANRLAARGLQAVDIGSAGGFLLKIFTAETQRARSFSELKRQRAQDRVKSGGDIF